MSVNGAIHRGTHVAKRISKNVLDILTTLREPFVTNGSSLYSDFTEVLQPKLSAALKDVFLPMVFPRSRQELGTFDDVVDAIAKLQSKLIELGMFVFQHGRLIVCRDIQRRIR